MNQNHLLVELIKLLKAMHKASINPSTTNEALESYQDSITNLTAHIQHCGYGQMLDGITVVFFDSGDTVMVRVFDSDGEDSVQKAEALENLVQATNAESVIEWSSGGNSRSKAFD